MPEDSLREYLDCEKDDPKNGLLIYKEHDMNELSLKKLIRRPCGLSVYADYYYSYNDDTGAKTLMKAYNQLSWKGKSAGIIRYEIERSYNGTPFEKIASIDIGHIPAEGPAYTDSSPQTYDEVIGYRVRAYTRNGYGMYSKIVTIPFPSHDPVPGSIVLE